MNIHRGAIYWVAAQVDGAEDTAGVSHPHVVVQDDLFNQSRIATVIVCPLTSNLDRAKEPGNVLLDPGEADLIRQSIVLSTRVTSVRKTDLGAYIGTLTPERVDQVLAALRFVQTSFLGER